MPPHLGGALHAAQLATADQRAEHIKTMARKSREKLEEELRIEADRQSWPWLRKALYAIVTAHWFECACGVVILLNMGLVAVETDASADSGDPIPWVETSTNILLGIYSTELFSKLYVFRHNFFREMWNVLDFVIVGTDIVFLGIGLFIEMPSISILRVARLVRLARAFKAAKSFRELNSLLRACSCALKAIFWGMILMIMALGVWGILAVQLIHPINQTIVDTKPWVYEGCERCPRAYATVFGSMLTFWKQLVAGDSWGTLCEPIIEEAQWTSVFFMLVLVTVNLTMLNCILAVVVEAGASAAAADEHDKSMQREKVVHQAEGRLIDICHALDGDTSGSLSIAEFMAGFRDNKDFRECMDVMHVTQEDMSMIFNICDEDDSGDVDYREFVDQLRRIKHSSEQILLHYVTDIRHRVNKIRAECLVPTKRGNEETPRLEEKHDQKSVNFESPELGSKARDIRAMKAEIENEGPLSMTAASLLALPPVISDMIRDGDDSNRKADKPQDKTLSVDLQQPAGVGVAIDDIVRKLELDRIWQSNADLVTIMTDLVSQSKVQSQLLINLSDGFQSGVDDIQAGRGGGTGSNQVAPYRIGSNPVVLRPSGTAGPLATVALRTSGAPGCCLRMA